VNVAYRNPQLDEINKTANKKVNPTVVGFTRSHRKYTSTIADTIAADATKRTIGLSKRFFTSGILV
jgi:hypothetical protein